jgi:hypothetical protein
MPRRASREFSSWSEDDVKILELALIDPAQYGVSSGKPIDLARALKAAHFHNRSDTAIAARLCLLKGQQGTTHKAEPKERRASAPTKFWTADEQAILKAHFEHSIAALPPNTPINVASIIDALLASNRLPNRSKQGCRSRAESTLDFPRVTPAKRSSLVPKEPTLVPKEPKEPKDPKQSWEDDDSSGEDVPGAQPAAVAGAQALWRMRRGPARPPSPQESAPATVSTRPATPPMQPALAHELEPHDSPLARMHLTREAIEAIGPMLLKTQAQQHALSGALVLIPGAVTPDGQPSQERFYHPFEVLSVQPSPDPNVKNLTLRGDVLYTPSHLRCPPQPATQGAYVVFETASTHISNTSWSNFLTIRTQTMLANGIFREHRTKDAFALADRISNIASALSSVVVAQPRRSLPPRRSPPRRRSRSPSPYRSRSPRRRSRSPRRRSRSPRRRSPPRRSPPRRSPPRRSPPRRSPPRHDERRRSGQMQRRRCYNCGVSFLTSFVGTFAKCDACFRPALQTTVAPPPQPLALTHNAFNPVPGVPGLVAAEPRQAPGPSIVLNGPASRDPRTQTFATMLRDRLL